MKRTLLVMISFVFMITCVACSIKNDENIPPVSQTVEPSASAPNEPVHFADPNFEQAIRTQINKPTGGVFPADVEAVDTLYLGQLEIENITGIEHFTSLRELDLTDNKVHDISRLAALTKLTSISLAGNNIADISSLSGLTHLKSLEVRDNYYIDDISVVANFSELEYIGFSFTNVSDISALSNLHKLSALPGADHTPVWDYSPITVVLEDIIENRKKDSGQEDAQWLADMEKDIRDIHKKNLQAGQVVKQTLADIIAPTMTDLEKEFAVFNFVVNNISYEFGGYETYSNSDLYNIFINKKGICHHYATAFSVLCNAAGVETYMVRGMAGGEDHVWNIAKIDDVYYQVDATWADEGSVNYDYFNRSTEAMYAHGDRESNRPDVDKPCPQDFTEAEMQKLASKYVRGA